MISATVSYIVNSLHNAGRSNWMDFSMF